MKVKLAILLASVVAVTATLMMPWQRSRDTALVELVAKLDGQWVGRRAPSFDLPDLAGNQHSHTEYAQKVIFLNIWASFCEPCRKEMPSMERLVRKYNDRGLVMLAISVDPEAQDASGFMQAFLSGQQSTMTVLHDPTAQTAAIYGTELLPETYIIDRNGRIVARFVNAYDWSRPEVEELIEHLLAEQGVTSRPLL